MNRYFVYILKCSDGSYYTGVTNNVRRRFAEHQSGLIPGCFTHGRRPVELVWNQSFRNANDAIRAEKQIKGWSRKKKEALVMGDWDLVSTLSRA